MINPARERDAGCFSSFFPRDVGARTALLVPLRLAQPLSHCATPQPGEELATPHAHSVRNSSADRSRGKCGASAARRAGFFSAVSLGCHAYHERFRSAFRAAWGDCRAAARRAAVGGVGLRGQDHAGGGGQQSRGAASRVHSGGAARPSAVRGPGRGADAERLVRGRWHDFRRTPAPASAGRRHCRDAGCYRASCRLCPVVGDGVAAASGAGGAARRSCCGTRSASRSSCWPAASPMISTTC